MTLAPQLIRHHRERRRGPGEVDRHDARDPVGVDLVDLLVPELPHGHDDQVDRLGRRLEAPQDGLVDVVKRRRRRRSLSRHAKAVAKVLRRLLERDSVASGEDDGSAPVREEQSDELSGDIRRTPEHNDRLGVTERVVHRGIPRRRERSDASTPSGSTLLQTLRHLAQPGVHDREKLRSQPGVLGQVDAATASRDRLVQIVQQRGQARGPEREVERQSPALLAEGERAGGPWTEAFQDGEEGGHPRRRDRSHGVLDHVARSGGHDELVLNEPMGSVEQVPPTDPVERVEERSQRTERTP